MTVSKVMRDAADISHATKARVRMLAQQMGYVPDSLARGLRTRTTRLLGLIIPSITLPTLGRMVLAIEEKAHEFGYELILAHTMNHVEREELAIRRLMSRRVDGLFISPVYRMAREAAIYGDVQRSRIPTVILGHSAPFCAPFVNVVGDDLQGAYSLARHLLDLGHRRIAFLAGIPASPSSKERFEGYRRALRESNIDVDDALVFDAGTTMEEGAKAALQLLNESIPVTAIQAVNDLVAIGAANILLEQGIRIPGDLSIAGFGNVLLSAHCRIPLTTVRQPKFRLGTAAMNLMHRLLQKEECGPQRLPAELVVRASTGRPPTSPRATTASVDTTPVHNL